MGSLFDALNARRRLLLGVLRSIAPPPGAAGIGDGAEVHRQPVPLGRSTVHLATLGADDARVVLVNLHENERTSVQAARALLAARAGQDTRLVVLRGQGRRNIVFWIGLRPFLFDPNRIFSDRGIDATLRFHGAASTAAHAALVGLREAIAGQWRPGCTALVVALHNNGIGHYTVTSYQPGGPHAADAEAVHADSRADPGDFFLVNQRTAFDALVDSGFGVVLQRAAAADDGSMSHHVTGTRPLYINVEARHGHLHEQSRMLDVLMDRTQRLASATASV